MFRNTAIVEGYSHLQNVCKFYANVYKMEQLIGVFTIQLQRVLYPYIPAQICKSNSSLSLSSYLYQVAMTFLAFTPIAPLLLHSKAATSRLYGAPCPRQVRVSRPICAPSWHASSRPGPGSAGSSSEDDRLNSELQEKVNELFGSRKNVSIDIETDSGVQFTVRRGQDALEYQQMKNAWSVFISVGVISVAAGVIFMALYYSGAVHGSQTPNRQYEMPTYGTRSYINPYEVLEEDRQFQDSQAH